VACINKENNVTGSLSYNVGYRNIQGDSVSILSYFKIRGFMFIWALTSPKIKSLLFMYLFKHNSA